jgi:hypothetical protein
MQHEYNDYEYHRDMPIFENEDTYRMRFTVPLTPSFIAITQLGTKFYYPLLNNKLRPLILDLSTQYLVEEELQPNIIPYRMSDFGNCPEILFYRTTYEEHRAILASLTEPEKKILLFYSQISFHLAFLSKNIDNYTPRLIKTYITDGYVTEYNSDDFYEPYYQNDDEHGTYHDDDDDDDDDDDHVDHRYYFNYQGDSDSEYEDFEPPEIFDLSYIAETTFQANLRSYYRNDYKRVIPSIRKPYMVC